MAKGYPVDGRIRGPARPLRCRTRRRAGEGGGRGAGAGARQPAVREAEVFAASNRALLTRLNYTSHIPCNGVEEPKSVRDRTGSASRRCSTRPGRPPHRLRQRAERSRRRPAPSARARQGARRPRCAIPSSSRCPRPHGATRAPHDLSRSAARWTSRRPSLVEAGWKIISGALRTFTRLGRLAELAGDEAGLRRLGLILGGDVTHPAERMAIASTAMPRAQTDEYVADHRVRHRHGGVARAPRAPGASTGTRLDHFTDEAGVGGRAERDRRHRTASACRRAPTRWSSVRQPVADLLNNIVIPAVHGRLLLLVEHAVPRQARPARSASPLLRLFDDGARRRA